MKEWEGGNKALISLVGILKYQEYYEWLLKKDVKDAYLALCKGGLCWCEGGLVRITHSVVMELFPRKVIEVDVPSKRVLRVNGWKVNGIEHNQVLDLNDDGERWEGDVLQNKPYGWGVVYDSENRMAYEGFRIGDLNACYGTRYYSDVGVIEYKGEWFEGKRWGRGIQYDRTGNTVLDGEWMSGQKLNKRAVLYGQNQFPHNRVEELIVGNNSCNGREWVALNLSFMPGLRVLQVGDKCFKYVKEVKWIGLSQLESIVIGKNSFTRMESEWDNDTSCHFYLKNCGRLRELKIGHNSFNEYTVCEIENVPSLEGIEMGELNEGSSNFYYASLELKSKSQRRK